MARGEVVRGHRSQLAQQVIKTFFAAGFAIGCKALQLLLDLANDARIEQFSGIGLAQQVSQQFAIQRQYRGPAFGQRGIGLIHKFCHIAEKQAGGER